jgi:phosphatidylserine/phosphatidylglycerophosphate/cardiolipin synthase-like enzyme
MQKYTFLLLFSGLLHGWVTAQNVVTIRQAKTLADGTEVTVRGIITCGPEFGRMRFVQDTTAGIGLFPGIGSIPDVDTRMNAGDSVEITGRLGVFRGLRQLSPIISFRVLAPNRPLPAPRVINAEAVNESLEGTLVRFDCATLLSADRSLIGAKQYDIIDKHGKRVHLYIRPESSLPGFALSNGALRLTGILSQSDDYQLLPRQFSDIAPANCFAFSALPTVGNIETNALALQWQTNKPAVSWLRYGLTPDAVGLQRQLPEAANQQVVLDGLQPATIYWTQVLAVTGRDTAWSEIRPQVTRSLSSGQVKVLFTRNLPADGPQADGASPAACIAEIVTRIDAAQRTIDVCMYNTNRTDLVDALRRAHARGVQIRYIAALETSSTALRPAPPFPVVYGNSFALMHNKFLVIDRESVNQSWVMGGSLNWTEGNFSDDFNNLIFVQDQSLARVYTLEFEEMWRDGRFGPLKKDDTPHELVVGGKRMECYFSPTDNISERIIQTLESADATADFALLTFTKDDIAQSLAKLQQRNIRVRGLIENINDSGSEFGFLTGLSIPVFAHRLTGVLHHKYCVVDANRPDSDPTVLTGSHNWSANAELRNDENTLVFHDERIAALFQAEFEQRFREQTVSTTLPYYDNDAIVLSPNPAQENIQLLAKQHIIGQLTVFDAAGRLMIEQPIDGSNTTLIVAGWPSGVYTVRFISQEGIWVEKVVKE